MNKPRQEHLAWCKRRALKHIKTGDLMRAFASMTSDLRKHPETTGHPGIALGVSLLCSGLLNTKHEMRKFIESFN